MSFVEQEMCTWFGTAPERVIIAAQANELLRGDLCCPGINEKTEALSAEPHQRHCRARAAWKPPWPPGNGPNWIWGCTSHWLTAKSLALDRSEGICRKKAGRGSSDRDPRPVRQDRLGGTGECIRFSAGDHVLRLAA